MKIQQEATRVLQRTSMYLQRGALTQKPMWFDVVGAHPAGMDLTKKPATLLAKQRHADPAEALYKQNKDFFKTSNTADERRQKNNHLNRVAKVQLVEDELRNAFYHQHPWEFARPKNLVETHGDEISKCDWLRMLQLYKPLDGESVVQRTMWLSKQGKPLLEAYDQARFEFYQLRMAEEMEAYVGTEEAGMYGAVFPGSATAAGLAREQASLDRWAERAGEKSKSIAAMNSKEGEEEDSSIWTE